MGIEGLALKVGGSQGSLPSQGHIEVDRAGYGMGNRMAVSHFGHGPKTSEAVTMEGTVWSDGLMSFPRHRLEGR